MRLTAGGQAVEIRTEADTAWIDGRPVAFRARRAEGVLIEIEIGGRIHPVRTIRSGEAVLVWAGGPSFRIRPAARAPRAAEHAGDLVSPMPGRVTKILAQPGESVQRGQPILVLEAMKMEHVMRAGRAGTVVRIAFSEGEQVESGATLAEIADARAGANPDTASEAAGAGS